MGNTIPAAVGEVGAIPTRGANQGGIAQKNEV